MWTLPAELAAPPVGRPETEFQGLAVEKWSRLVQVTSYATYTMIRNLAVTQNKTTSVELCTLAVKTSMKDTQATAATLPVGRETLPGRDEQELEKELTSQLTLFARSSSLSWVCTGAPER